jgi:hypothetical protein
MYIYLSTSRGFPVVRPHNLMYHHSTENRYSEYVVVPSARMTNKKIITILSPLIICSTFILSAAVGMLIYPETFHKFFSSPTSLPEPPHGSHSYYWDVELYARKALNPNCDAFYPLWPFIIRTLFHPQTIQQAAHDFVIVATTLFFISTILLFWVFKTGFKSSKLAFLLVLAYTVNPTSIFRVIGYTESLFSTLSTLFIWIFLPQSKLNTNLKLLLISVLTFLMALTRPVLIQILFASTGTLITIFTFEIIQLKTFNFSQLLNILKKYLYEVKATITVWISSLLGYSIYGNFCQRTRGNFFAPFLDQKSWGKKLGLHLEFLFIPKSLLIDLLGLYLPLIILVIAITIVYFKVKQQEPYIYTPKHWWWNLSIIYPPLLIFSYIFNFMKNRKNTIFKQLNKLKTLDYTYTLSQNYIFWFCIYFTAIHPIIVFFTQNRLFSMARFVFALPFLFLAIGYIYRCIPGKTKYNTLKWLTVLSTLSLIEQWIRYGQNKWIG